MPFAATQRCPSWPLANPQELQHKFASLSEVDITERTSEVFSDIMDTIRQHQVHLPGQVSTVVVTALVLEGWSSKLDPKLRIMDTLREMLPSNWSDRVGRAVDKIVDRGLCI